MATSTLLKSQDGKAFFQRAWLMESFFERARGLIGNDSPDPSQAWIFENCSSAHTCFMSAPIDIVETDALGRVLSVRTVPPWRFVRPMPNAEHVIETAAGSARKAGLKPGIELTWR